MSEHRAACGSKLCCSNPEWLWAQWTAALQEHVDGGEADNNQLCYCCCCSNPKHLTMSIVNCCFTRTCWRGGGWQQSAVLLLLLQQPKAFDYEHSELLLYKNMLTGGEADNNQLCYCCCCSNPKHLTMSIVNYCCTRTWSCGRLAWTRRPCSTLMSTTARLLTASTSVKPQVRPLPFCRLWMSNGNRCFGCCW